MIRNFLPISVAMICPHLSSDNCNCRKPRTGLIKKYRELYTEMHQKELFIGDQKSDEQCAKKLDIPYIMVNDSTSLYNKIDSLLETH